MNIEKLLNYMLADGFKKLALTIEDAIEGQEMQEDRLKHMYGFLSILKGEAPAVEAASIHDMMNQLGTLQGADTPQEMKEMLDVLRRDTRANEGGNDKGVDKASGDQDGGVSVRGVAEGDERGDDAEHHGDSDTDAEGGGTGGSGDKGKG